MGASTARPPIWLAVAEPRPVRVRPTAPARATRPPRRGRRTRGVIGLGTVLVGFIAVTAFDPGTTVILRSVVDFTRVVQEIAPTDVGVGISTYGATPLDGPAQEQVERALDARTVRIPVAFRGGVVTSGAAGAGDVDVVGLVRTYRSWGWRVMVVIDGRSADNDVAAGDTTRIVQALGYGPDLQYTTSNEPRDAAADPAAVLGQARMIVAEGRALTPSFTVWAPAWASYDRDLFRQVATALGPALAGIDFHRYAMGETALSTDAAMQVAIDLGDEVAGVVSDLAAAGSDAAVAVDELNLTWRYDDGTPGGDRRVFTSASTTWIASACGHILVAGGRCLPYAMQNGPLGMTVEDGTPNPDDRSVSSPLPAYWGIGAWTGASRFPHVAGAMYACTSGSPSLDVFAADNEAGGRDIVLVNRSTTDLVTTRLQLQGRSAGTYTSFAGDPDRPYDPPVESGPRSYESSVEVSLRPLSVTTIVLAPSPSPGAGR